MRKQLKWSFGRQLGVSLWQEQRTLVKQNPLESIFGGQHFEVDTTVGRTQPFSIVTPFELDRIVLVHGQASQQPKIRIDIKWNELVPLNLRIAVCETGDRGGAFDSAITSTSTDYTHD